MRPVTRGNAPPGARTYEEMRPTLIDDRLGCYCSYCEFPVEHQAHAEHVVPKDRFPAWRDRWDNLIVSCTYCNSHKGNQRPEPERLDEYLWPTRDNTARAFTYTNVVPEVADGLSPELQRKAALLRGLVKLGLMDDRRAKKRADVYIKAQWYFSQLSSAAYPDLLREAIVDIAAASGFFSVWMEIFASDLWMRRSLIERFKGTAKDCFDPETTQPVPRPGGQL